MHGQHEPEGRGQTIKNWAYVCAMLVCIIGFGYIGKAIRIDRAWIPINDAPAMPGLRIVEDLPLPFKLNYPGASKVWLYQQEDVDGAYLVAVFYQKEIQGEELVGSGNGFLDNDLWRHGPPLTNVFESTGMHEFSEVVYHSPGHEPVTIVSQYRFAFFVGETVPLAAKLYGLWGMVTGANGAAQLSVIFTGERSLAQINKQSVMKMAQELFPAIEEQINHKCCNNRQK